MFVSVSAQRELLARAEKDFQARKAEVLQRMRGVRGGDKDKDKEAFTPAELALVENSDDDEGEADIQRLIADSKSAAGSASAGGSSSSSSSSAEDADLLRSHVELPSQEDISELLLAEKRKALLATLASL